MSTDDMIAGAAGVDADSEVTAGLGRKALFNSAQLGAALVASWTLSLAGRFLLPRILGEESYGQIAFIESVAVLAMSTMAFGVDDYIRKEVTVRPQAAMTFARPLLQLRFVSGIAITATMAVAFAATSGAEQAVVAFTFGLAQTSIVLGQTTAAYLQARHEVKVVSLSAIATKVLWFVLLLAIAGVNAELLALPVALLISELFRNIWLNDAVRGLYGRAQPAPIGTAIPVLRASLPYYINSLNVIFMAEMVRILTGIIGGKRALAQFSVANLGFSVPMLFIPLVAWIVIPVFSTLRSRSEVELWGRVRTLVDVTAVPMCAVAVALFAVSDQLMNTLFGSDFGAAGPAFAALVLSLPATYFTATIGGAFISDGRDWQNTRVNVYTMVLVLVVATVVLVLPGVDDPGESAWRSAMVIAVGEWITVAALIVLRPFGTLGRATMLRLAIIVVAFLAVSADKLGGGNGITPWLAYAVVVLVGITDLPRGIAVVEEMLASRRPRRPFL